MEWKGVDHVSPTATQWMVCAPRNTLTPRGHCCHLSEKGTAEEQLKTIHVARKGQSNLWSWYEMQTLGQLHVVSYKMKAIWEGEAIKITSITLKQG